MATRTLHLVNGDGIRVSGLNPEIAGRKIEPYKPSTTIEFPDWVQPPTPCEFRSHTVAVSDDMHGIRWGTYQVDNTFPMATEKENGGFPARLPF